MYRSCLVNTLVTHAYMKGLGLTPLFRDRRGFMPPQLKTKQKQNTFTLLFYNIKEPDLWKRLLLECIYYLGDLEHGGLELVNILLSVFTFILLFYNIKEPDLICILKSRFMKKTAVGAHLLPRWSRTCSLMSNILHYM